MRKRLIPRPAECPACGELHFPDEAHTLSEIFRETYQAKHGRLPTWRDAINDMPEPLRALAMHRLGEKGIEPDEEV